MTTQYTENVIGTRTNKLIHTDTLMTLLLTLQMPLSQTLTYYIELLPHLTHNRIVFSFIKYVSIIWMTYTVALKRTRIF